MSDADPRLAQLASTGGPGLIVVDVQRSFGDAQFLPWLDAEGLAAVDTAVDGVLSAVGRARAAGVPVFWVRLVQSSAVAWRSSLWLRGVATSVPWPSADEPCVEGTPGVDWYRVAPREGEAVVDKTRYSGFFGTDLATRLTAAGVGWVTVVGLTSECCVDMTARDAFQHEFAVVIPADATTAYDPALRESALKILGDNVAVISTVDEVGRLWLQQAARVTV